MTIGAWTSRFAIQVLGAALGAFPLFLWGWLRASNAVNRSPDDAKKRTFRRLNRRLSIAAVLGLLAFVALALVLKSNGPGDRGVLFGIIPLALMLILVLDVRRTWMAIWRLR